MTRLLMLAAVLLAGCAPRAPEPAASPSATATPTVGPDPAAAAIAPLPADAAAPLVGELRCGFEGANGLLLAAAADVGIAEPIAAVAMTDGRPVALRGERPGGFDQLRRGGGFVGGGLRATVTLQDAVPTGNEGSVHAALLTLVPTGERTRTARGRWVCGP